VVHWTFTVLKMLNIYLLESKHLLMFKHQSWRAEENVEASAMLTICNLFLDVNKRVLHQILPCLVFYHSFCDQREPKLKIIETTNVLNIILSFLTSIWMWIKINFVNNHIFVTVWFMPFSLKFKTVKLKLNIILH
jgi:hypothetical protein